MNDLRTAAQAVIDLLDRMDCGVDIAEHDAIVEALHQALAKPVEPVAYLIYKHGELYTTKSAHDYRPKGGAYTEIPLYTTPPSVDALIAEAVAKEREACAELCIQMGTEPMEWQPSKLGIRPEHWDVAQAIRARGQK